MRRQYKGAFARGRGNAGKFAAAGLMLSALGGFGVLDAALTPASAAPVGAAPAGAAAAVTQVPLSAATGALPVDIGKGVMVRLAEDAVSVFVSDPAVADVQVPNPRAIFVLGRKAGTTTLYVMGANNKQILSRTVVVERDLTALQTMLASRFPTLALTLHANGSSLEVMGKAPTPRDADAVVQALTPYLLDKEVLVNRMTVDKPLQVQLRVRITEVDRNITQQLGINWQSIGNVAGNFYGGVFGTRGLYDLTQPIVGSSGQTTYPIALSPNNAYSLFGAFKTGRNDIEALIDALNQEGLVTILAEPNLVAMSGETASFLAGGEFPIPVSQINGVISIDFKQFGIKLDFTPTVLDDRRISLKVRPEVSQIDSSVTITTGGITVPGLSVRRADTTVELGSGQSFAIAGLLQTNTSDIVSQIPGLGSIPILGKLFSSTKYINNKSELVIMVTPYIVEPTSPARLKNALSEVQSVLAPSSDIEYSVGQSKGAAARSDQPRLVGNAGFVY